MTHLLAERKGEVFRSKCGVQAQKGETTIWNQDVSCLDCIAQVPYLKGTPRVRLIRRRKLK